MRALVLIFLVSISFTCLAQDKLKYKLLERSYYIENQPKLKIFGEKSVNLREKYGTDFLSLGKQYIQVYNYATYYRWFFMYHKETFPDFKTFEELYKARDTKQMFLYIKKNWKEISRIAKEDEAIKKEKQR